MLAYLVVPLTFPLVQQAYPVGLALRYASILAASGVLVVSYGILLSVVLEGISWPAIIGMSSVFLCLLVGQLPAAAPAVLRQYSLFSVLSGESYYRFGFMPWGGISTCVLGAVITLSLALWLVKWRDF
jgi:hypothetical protein